MNDDELIKELQSQIRELETENTRLREPPPQSTARHQVEALIFEVKRLHAQVERCESLLKAYQQKMREVTDDFWARNPPRRP